MKSKKRNKKCAALLMVAACIVCIIGMIILKTDFSEDRDSQDTSTKPTYIEGEREPGLCAPDWNTDIFTLDRYMELNRYLTVTRNGISEVITDYDYRPYGDTVVMMADYFDTLMHGDAEKLNSFYTDEYFTENKRFEKITMQKIYDMEMEYITERDDNINGVPCTVYIYKVSYKILENDGTFRTDLIDDTGKIPLFYELIDFGGGVKISKVMNNYTK